MKIGSFMQQEGKTHWTKPTATSKKVIEQPHRGLSDHVSMLLISAYTPVRRRAPLNHKDFVNLSRKFITLAAGLLSVEHQDLKEHTTSVLCYIIFSVDSVTMD